MEIIAFAYVAWNIAVGTLALGERVDAHFARKEYVMSKSLEYGRACLEELETHAGMTVKVREIAERRGIPPAYCQKVLRLLSKGGLAHSCKGEGFEMIWKSSEISDAQIKRALKGKP